MKKLVVLTGAGMSAESGINTFRDANGLWEGHNVMDVASPEGWYRDQDLVLDFYNQRRKQLFEVKPNYGHELLAQLQSTHQVKIVTQNVASIPCLIQEPLLVLAPTFTEVIFLEILFPLIPGVVQQGLKPMLKSRHLKQWILL